MAKNTSKYAFILGRLPELSRAEIKAFLDKIELDYKILAAAEEIFLIETDRQVNLEAWQDALGGTIKIATIESEVKVEKLQQAVWELLVKKQRDSQDEDSKFQFGFSYYGDGNDNFLKKIGLDLKRKFTEAGFKSRLVVSREKILSSVIISKEKLIENGADVIVIPKANNKEYYLGLTRTIQDFQAYSVRDYSRPTRDDRSGMLPPKLARMMINLSGAKKSDVILDPFCGSGTILTEALFLGYENLIGSDISEKAVEFSKNNLSWLKKQYQLNIKKVKVFQLDSRELTDLLEPKSVDCIVAEPYLGPPRHVGGDEAFRLIEELSELYLKTFKSLAEILKTGGRAVFILPIINGQQFNILNEIKSLGFEIQPLTENIRGSVIYSRPGQKVMREIFLFKKSTTP